MAVKTALIVFGALILTYGVAMSFFTHFSAGLVLILFAGACLLSAGVLYTLVQKYLWARIVLGTGVAMLFVALILGVSLAVYGRKDNVTYKENVLIVLGCGVEGERIPSHLRSRLEAAYSYYLENPNVLIVVSGGQGKGEAVTEALAMEKYLVEKGVPEDKIIKEEASSSTRTNLIYSKEILDAYCNKEYTVAIVSSEYHLYRAVSIAKELGLNCTHAHAKTVGWETPIRYTRELMAIAKSVLFD